MSDIIFTFRSEINLNEDFDENSKEWLKLNYIINNVRDSITNNDNTDLLKLYMINMDSLRIPKDPRLNEWSLYQFAVHLYDKFCIL